MGVQEEEQDRSHLAVIEDPNVKIKPGKRLHEYLETQSRSPTKYLSIGEVKELYSVVQKEKGIYLNELLQGSDVVLPELVVPPRNPELQKRITALRKSLDQQAYDRMTRDVDLSKRYVRADAIGFQVKQMNSGLIGVFQFVVTVAAAFAFGFMGIEVFASSTFEPAVKLLLGIICALIVACAELYFLLRTLDFAEVPTDRRAHRSNSLFLNPLLKESVS